MTYTYQPYPRRLYLRGEVISGDLHATNSVVVGSVAEEASARAHGYLKAYETSGGNDGSHQNSVPGIPSGQDQDGVAPISADPSLDDLRAKAESRGIKVDRRWKEARLLEEIAR